MSVPGVTVLRELQQSLEEVRSQATSLRSQYQQLSDNMKKLVDERSDTFRELAKFYLPDLSPESIASTLVGIRDELWEVLAPRNAASTN